MNEANNTPRQNGNEDASVQPDKETLHTPDPQKKMEGPLSSLMHGAGAAFDTDETFEEAEEKKGNGPSPSAEDGK